MKESLINNKLSIPTDDKSVKILQPCKSPLNCPSTLIKAAISVAPAITSKPARPVKNIIAMVETVREYYS